ncbi:phage tail protein [Sphingomonas sp. R86521]|uniref:phage tail protein n=1 Tax=Sphingomonas sp. R86521 TaxID=3093860 RepID=UPI0036D2B7CB
MATLVLTVVGTAVGGPVGGAIGALVGQAIDHAVFRPKRREGPRLTELAVQTSSYGSQIPLLFGTMRVAGTVIWATDLVESRSTAHGGKGEANTTVYGYSASFAVLLSARAIIGVGRIWAEGKLLRGAAGDFKTATGFRLHLGDEEQAVDPLIGSAETDAPAHRGCAYAVFEGMQLADYGNRIPSLTFEVVADPGAVSVGSIARMLAAEVGGDAALTLDGFAASGGSIGAVLATLGQASGAWFAADGGGLAMRDHVGELVQVADAGFGTQGRRARTVAAIDTVPRTVSVGHYDPARDYQAGLQRATRPGAGSRDERVEVPAVIDAGTAKTIAEALLARAEAGRVRRTVTCGFEGLAIAPGACVAVADEPGVWRVAEVMVEGMVTRLTLVPLEIATLPARATSGRVAGAVDATIGATILAVFETPGLDDVPLSAPRLTVAAAGAGAGWRRAALLYSLDDGASWTAGGATADPAVIGVVEVVPLRSAPATLIDLDGAFVVALAHDGMVLGDADEAALDRGVNLAVVGSELVQFGSAAPLGGGRWRLTRLLRGRRGTEAAVPVVGDRFVLLEREAARAIELPVSAIGREVRVMASGVGDDDPVELRCMIGGASVVPPSPVHLRIEGATLRWVRRSRAGWRWIDRVDAPLGEESEAYRVAIAGAAGARVVDCAVPYLDLAAGDRVAGTTIEVRQVGQFGESIAATLVLGTEILGRGATT